MTNIIASILLVLAISALIFFVWLTISFPTKSSIQIIRDRLIRNRQICNSQTHELIKRKFGWISPNTKI